MVDLPPMPAMVESISEAKAHFSAIVDAVGDGMDNGTADGTANDSAQQNNADATAAPELVPSAGADQQDPAENAK